MIKLLEKLNNPVAVVVILAAILAINGFLLYQQRSTTPQTGAEQEAAEEAPAENGAEQTPEAGDRPTEPTTEEETRQPEDREDGDREEEPAPEEESPEEEDAPEQDAAEEDAPEEDAPEEDAPDEDRPREEPEEREPEEREPEQREPEQREPEQREGREPDERGVEREAGEGAPLAGLGEAVEECDGDREGCVREFVSRVAPEARYIGGRTDLDPDEPDRNVEVMYFEDPEMDACEFERERHETDDGLDYTVILVGPGSFEDERGEECIPRT